MRTRALPALSLLIVLLSAPAGAQIIESTGSRALGMGGAFVAVGTDSSATWWNPGAVAAGPFVDSAVGYTHGLGDTGQALSSFTIAAPMLGFSYYRVHTPLPSGSTGANAGDRQDTGTSLLGVTLVQSVVSGIHVGTTLKYVRGLGLAGEAVDSSGFDLDVGGVGVYRFWRFGAVAKNLRGVRLQPDLLPRQFRAGVAFDGDALPGGMPLTVSADVDLKPYPTPSGNRQVVAAGVERWLLAKRLGLRGGGRVNTRGANEKAATAGASVMVKSGMYIDAHVVMSGADDERSWGIAARVSF